MRNPGIFLALVLSLTATAPAQRLSSYDAQSTNHEVAGVRCPRNAPAPITRKVQRLPWAFVGSNATPNNLAFPNVYSQVTGMVIDPTDPTGSTMWLTDGLSILRYSAGTAGVAPVIAGPFPTTFAGCGTILTGLTYDPWLDEIVAVDDTTWIYRFDPIAMAWLTPAVMPVAPAPQMATGVQMCSSAFGTIFVDISNGFCGTTACRTG